ncbi:hypothetical protein HG537_0B05600 [Torulaspora globosa]|uniref:Zn(2)-C6 fungal-type domain-containing protein n=1 Tax=Torulaspora globosa TaxID=48254 RepID=A0A7H9HPD2_9SACH|nr:hypothetical protein HG537_0B05600 [Torulaspora sp. CBS 2947]
MSTSTDLKEEDRTIVKNSEPIPSNTETELRHIKRPSTPEVDLELVRLSKQQKCKVEEIPSTPSGQVELRSLSGSGTHQGSTGHRPVTSCTHCRQHKIKCNASENYPSPCSRCERMGLHCEIDPQFRPKKGSQLQNLRRDVDELKLKIEYLTRKESLITRALQESDMGRKLIKTLEAIDVSKISQLSNKKPEKLRQRPLRSNVIQHQQFDRKVSVQTYLASEPQLLQDDPKSSAEASMKDSHSITSDKTAKQPFLLNDSAPANNNKDALPPVLQMALQRNTSAIGTPTDYSVSHNVSPSLSPLNSSHSISKKSEGSKYRDEIEGKIPHNDNDPSPQKKVPVVATTNAMPLLPSPYASIDEFVLGDVRISIEKANELHNIFVTKYLPYFPILSSNSATELYSQSQFLFWTAILTACLSDVEPSLYMKLSSLIKQLAIETCWIRTPRSTHISQALLILCIWPLPNQKVLDDCSYRFVGLAKSLSYQLGLHRGKFIAEFTRTQTSMPDAEKWRTRTWLGIFFAELCWASILGLPPTSQTDYLIENARFGQDDDNGPTNNPSFDISDKKETQAENGKESSASSENHEADYHDDKKELEGNSRQKSERLPRSFRRLICLASFQAKLCKVMGSSVVSPDGLMEPRDRASSLAILERELELLDRKLNFEEDICVHIYYLYVKLMVCCFAFLPDTPTEDQSQYVTEAYLSATKIVTLLTNLLDKQQLIELPIYIRHSATFAALILFKLQLTPLLLNKYLDSARQSIVTVHRVFRNQLSAWATAVENDISRTASVLEKLNFVLITHPTVFVEEEGIISRMRSHLTDSLFYDLVWCIHEARRREMDPKYDEEAMLRAAEKQKKKGNGGRWALDRKLHPLPFYNQISKEDFETIIQTTPNGTTITKLVPTKTALKHAKKLAKTKKDSNGAIVEINGIPLSMLDETGSVSLENFGTNPSRDSLAFKLDKLSQTSKISQAQEPNITASKDPAHQFAGSYASDRHAESDNEDNHPSKIYTPTISSFLNDTSMQRSSSTPPNQPTARPSRVATNSLFVMNNSLASNLSLNRSFSLSHKIQTPDADADADALPNNVTEPKPPLKGQDSFPNLNLFLQSGSPTFNTADVSTNGNPSRSAIGQLSDLENFFQQQSTGWIEGNSINDDFLGWFDMNMEPEF